MKRINIDHDYGKLWVSSECGDCEQIKDRGSWEGRTCNCSFSLWHVKNDALKIKVNSKNICKRFENKDQVKAINEYYKDKTTHEYKCNLIFNVIL